MEKHELFQLEAHIQALKTAHSAMSDTKVPDELLRIIHQPGWTTPAERLLVTASLEYLVAQAKLLVTLQENVLAGAKAVGRAHGANA